MYGRTAKDKKAKSNLNKCRLKTANKHLANCSSRHPKIFNLHIHQYFNNNQIQLLITCDNPRTREGRGHKTRGQQSPANPIQQDERPWHISRRTCCGTSSHY